MLRQKKEWQNGDSPPIAVIDCFGTYCTRMHSLQRSSIAGCQQDERLVQSMPLRRVFLGLIDARLPIQISECLLVNGTDFCSQILRSGIFVKQINVADTELHPCG